MRFYFRLFGISLFLYCLGLPLSSAANEDRQVPDLLLANIYQADVKVQNYWVSEKYDGVRAYWNGVNFVSRQGNIYTAPPWFTDVLPDIALDGELWLGRGKFDKLSGVVRRYSPDDSSWSDIKFMIFDLPGHAGVFDERLQRLEEIVADIHVPHIKLVEQFKVSNHEVLIKKSLPRCRSA